MIKVNELRIGNIVQRAVMIELLDGGVKYAAVNQVMLRDCEYYKDYWAYEAVPLTEEILLKCGFKKQENEFVKSVPTEKDSLFFISKSENGFDLIFTHKKCRWYVWNISILHHLQNVLYYLYNQELNFDLLF
jgi:hypothetical protein